MGIVQIVGRTNGNIIDVRSLPSQFFTMPVEAFEFGEEMSFGEVFVEYAYGIVFVQGCKEVVARSLYGFEMPGSDVAGGADEEEVFNGFKV